MSNDHDPEVGRLAAEVAKAAAEQQKYRRKDFWVPYSKQSQFFATGLRYRERALFAGTQLGKTECAAFEVTCHLTGEYPPDWPGRKFEKPVRVWAVSESQKMVRDIQQKKLCGEPNSTESWGAGMIPRDRLIGDPVLARGEGGAFDTVQVRHRERWNLDVAIQNLPGRPRGAAGGDAGPCVAGRRAADRHLRRVPGARDGDRRHVHAHRDSAAAHVRGRVSVQE